MPLSAVERSRLCRQRLKQNPEKYLTKEKKRYEHRKETGDIKLMSEISSRQQRNTRHQWKENNMKEKERKW
jgi:hypothetical protein